MQTANDILLLEKHLDFWEHLTDSQQEYLISNTKSVHYSAGEFLHYADSDCLGLLLIKSGQIRTFLLSEEGREITLYRLEQGDICILSASCILHSISFEVSITAETDCEILQISSFAFAKISSENIMRNAFPINWLLTVFQMSCGQCRNCCLPALINGWQLSYWMSPRNSTATRFP